jgi:4-hydroxy-tetrahydrodipicolinate reductase
MTTKVAVVGATGKMGRLASEIIAATEDFEVVAQIDSKGSLSEMIGADIAFDVTQPAVSQGVVDFAISQSVADAGDVGVIIIPNFSVGSVLATSFAAMASRFFDSIEIVESHHLGKSDSPSGTAVRTAELIGVARSERGPVVAPHADQRARGQQVSSVPIHSLRMQGIVAKQDVHFGGQGEVLTISHDTIDPSAYRAGIVLALRAARDARGVTVGLDKLIDLGSPNPA